MIGIVAAGFGLGNTLAAQLADAVIDQYPLPTDLPAHSYNQSSCVAVFGFEMVLLLVALLIASNVLPEHLETGGWAGAQRASASGNGRRGTPRGAASLVGHFKRERESYMEREP